MHKLTINNKKLLEGLNTISPIVNDKSTIPILSSFAFEILEEKLTLKGSNANIKCKLSLDVESESDFGFCVSKTLILNILSGLGNSELNVEFDKNEIVISCKIGKYTLPVSDISEYPKTEENTESTQFKVDTELFLIGLKKSIPFVDNTIENLNGILIKSSNKKLIVASVNNTIFYENEFDYNGDDIEVVLTSESASFLTKVMYPDSEALISYNKKTFSVSFDDISIEINQLDCRFPNYRKILDSLKNDGVLTLNKLSFLDSLKRFYSISDKDNKTLVLDVGKSKIIMNYENDFIKNKATETIDCEYTGEPFKIGFDVNKLRNAVSILEEDLSILVKNQSTPFLFKESNTRVLVASMKILDK